MEYIPDKVEINKEDNNIYIIGIIVIVIIVIVCFFMNKKYENIYLTMTTIPERLIHPWFYENLKHTLNLNGEFKILLNIPYKFKSTSEDYIIPQNVIDLQKNNLIINRVNEDYGPITKLFGALLNDNIPDNSPLLVCDDDIHYSEDFVKLIYDEYLKDDTKIYTYCIPTIEGFKGFMFKKSLLKPILKINRPESCFRIDDNLIQLFVKNNNINVKTVSYHGEEKKYSDYRKGFCSFDINIHDNKTPKWRELKNDNRNLLSKQCIKDFYELNNNKIPKNIYQTYKNKNIPEIVKLRWNKLNPDYKYFLYDDNDCYNFLLNYYNKEIADIFRYKIKHGPIKSDFWRVCILYIFGGIYADIDIKPIISIDNILNKDITFYTCINDKELDIFNLNPHFIAVTPKNELIKQCIDKYIEYDKFKPYSYHGWSITKIMYNVLKDFLNIRNFKEGIYKNNGQKIQLSQEVCPYGDKGIKSLGQCFIKQNNEIIMYNRDDNIYDSIQHKFN